MSAQAPTLSSLAETVSTCANGLAAQLQAGGFPPPSFDENGPLQYPNLPEVMGLRMQLLNAINNLQRMAMGPVDQAFTGPLFLNHDATILNVLNEFDFWRAVPIGGSASVQEIAAKVDLAPEIVHRALRYGLATRVLAPSPSDQDKTVHTAFSAALVKRPNLQAWLSYALYECRFAGIYFAESLRTFGLGKGAPSEEPAESGFAMASLDRTKDLESFWDYIARDVEGKPKAWRSATFAEAMKNVAAMSGIRIEDVLLRGYDWKSLGEATVVDDLSDLESSYLKAVPEDLQGRIRFEAHDFFGPQDTKGSVYLLKHILHDWPDKYAAKVIKNLVPQLETGAILLLVDSVSPPPEMMPPGQYVPRMMSAADLQMLTLFNTSERSLERWASLLSKADGRLEVKNVTNVPGAMHSFIEVRLKAD